MNFKIAISQSNRVLEANNGQSVLDVALGSEIPYPHSCKNGKCGACKSRLISGEIEHLSYNKFTLNESEKKSGVFLACRTIPKSDIEVQWLEESSDCPLIRTKGVVSDLSRLTASVYKIRLRLQKGTQYKFKAGQFANLKIGNCPVRSYSMASGPSDSQELEFLIKKYPGGCASGHVANALAIGDMIEIEGPLGQAYLRRSHTGPILMVAAGTGIAPLVSMLRDIEKIGMRQDIHFYFGIFSGQDSFYRDELSQLAERHSNIHVHFAVEKEAPVGSRMGRVGDVVLSDWPEFKGEWHAYLAGPAGMVEALIPVLDQRGIPSDHIYSDPFYDQWATNELETED